MCDVFAVVPEEVAVVSVVVGVCTVYVVFDRAVCVSVSLFMSPVFEVHGTRCD